MLTFFLFTNDKPKYILRVVDTICKHFIQICLSYLSKERDFLNNISTRKRIQIYYES